MKDEYASASDLHAVFRHLEKIYRVDEGTAQADERDVLVTLIEAYENKHYALGRAKAQIEASGLP